MKIRNAVYIAIASISVLVVVFSVYDAQTIHENKIRIAYFPNVGHMVPIVGIEKGFFSNNLTETVIETRLFDSGPQVIESLFANSIDIAYVGPGPIITGFVQSKNSGMQILAGAASGGASFIVNPDSKILSAEDLGGKRIAVPLIGNSQDISFRNYLNANGLKPAEKGGSVYVLNLQNPEIYTLFAKGDIDGAWIPEPWASLLVNDLGGQRLFYEEDLWPNNEFASVLLVARTEFIKQNPDVINNWIKSNSQVVNWINENPDESKLIFNQFLVKEFGKSIPEKVVNDAFSNMKITNDPIASSVYTFAEHANSLGYLGRNQYTLDGLFYNVQLNENLVKDEL